MRKALTICIAALMILNSLAALGFAADNESQSWGEAVWCEFTDSDGARLGELEGKTEVNAKVTLEWPEVPPIAVLAVYDNNVLVGAALGSATDGASAYICEASVTGLEVLSENAEAKVFVMKSARTIEPIWDTIVFSLKSDKFSMDGRIIDGTGEELEFLNGYSGQIKAVFDFKQGEDAVELSASLTAFRNGTKTYENMVPITLKDGEAKAELVFETTEDYATLPTLGDGDELVAAVLRNGKEVFEKRLQWNDQSKIVDILLVAGQSNSIGDRGDKNHVLKAEAGAPVYRSLWGKATDAAAVRVATVDGVAVADQGPLHSWDSALAKTWHEETGRAVLIVQTGRGGTGFPKKPAEDGTNSVSGSALYGYWNPDNNMPLSNIGSGSANNPTPANCYLRSKIMYEAALKSIPEDYTIGRRIYFWCQGCNENSRYTAGEYKEAFLELHNKFTTEFGDKNNTGLDADYPLELGGIMPVRSNGTDWRAAYTLELTGPRIAHYDIAATTDNVFIVADAVERWCSNPAIKAWFEEKYEWKEFYAGADKTMPYQYLDAYNTPDVFEGVISDADTIHYTQYAMNELGMEMAHNMLAHIHKDNKVDGIDLITDSGLKHIKNGEKITLSTATSLRTVSKWNADKTGLSAEKEAWNLKGAIPVMPAESGIEGVFTLDDNTLTVSYTEDGEAKQMSFDIEVASENAAVKMVNGVLVVDTLPMEIAAIPDNKQAIYSLTTDDGKKYTNTWLTEKLRERGLKGTMGLITGSMGTDSTSSNLTWEEAQTLAETGVWSIANHTKQHYMYSGMTETYIRNETSGARTILREKFPDQRVLALYTASGYIGSDNAETAALMKKVIFEDHIANRGASGGAYTAIPVSEDAFFNLSAYGVGKDMSANSATKLNTNLDNGVKAKAWVIEMWHGVGETKDDGSKVGDVLSWGGYIAPEEAEAHLDYVKQLNDAGTIWVATLEEAAVYARQRSYTKLSLKSKADTEIVFALEDNFPMDAPVPSDLTLDEVYNAILTVNVTLPTDWTNGVTVKQGGEAIAYTLKDGILTVNLARNSGNVVVTKN